MIQKVEGQLNCDIALGESEKKHVLKLYRETMLQAYNFGFEVSYFPKRPWPSCSKLVSLTLSLSPQFVNYIWTTKANTLLFSHFFNKK